MSSRCPKCGRFMRVTRYLIHMPGHKGWHERRECSGRNCFYGVHIEPELGVCAAQRTRDNTGDQHD